MTSSSSTAGAAAVVAPTELAVALATRLKSSPASLETASRLLFDELVDEVTLGVAFEMHRNAKTGVLPLLEVPVPSPTKSSSGSSTGYATDVFGSVIQTSTGVPALKKQPECTCPNCNRNMAATRFAPHLEKCMGMGRNSSRLASRRLATASKAGTDDDNEAPGDEDWIEPGPAAGSGGRIHHHHADMAGPAIYHGPGRRKRDRNSPRRTKGRNKNNNSGQTSSGDPSSHEGSAGTITPPTDLELLTLEERSYWLSAICGVMSVTSRKICSRSTRCPVHSDAQRKEVRLKWLGGGVVEDEHHDPLQPEDTHVDIDSFTEGDTAALRESLAQLSGASSPAESVVSTTSSNPSSSVSQRGGGGNRRGGGGRNNRGGKKGGRQPGSKGGSRGSTPPLMMLE